MSRDEGEKQLSVQKDPEGIQKANFTESLHTFIFLS